MSAATRAQRIKALQRRLSWLEVQEEKHSNSFQRREIEALRWALPILEEHVIVTSEAG